MAGRRAGSGRIASALSVMCSAMRSASRAATLASLLALAGALPCAPAFAGELLKLPTRPGVSTVVFWEPVAAPRATLLLLPGGAGGFGQVAQGRATGANFLVRSAPLFAAQGFNVAVAGRPSDIDDLDYELRLGERHQTDLREVLAELRRRSPAPVWLVGTSRGTVSAVAAALRLQDQLAGLVLSSSIVAAGKTGNLASQDLAALKLPVLMVHHRQDACGVCPPAAVPTVLAKLSAAPVKQLLWADGGSTTSGEACGALHRHGYIGIEAEVVAQISAWIQHPK